MTDDARGYLEHNDAYWERGMFAPNVESHVFRFYGRILRHDFKLVGDGETIVDFGCGQGATVNFFAQQGFDAWGCDIGQHDLDIARIRYPHLARKLLRCAPDPRKNAFYCVEANVAVVTALDVLYYLSDTDFELCVATLAGSLRPGGVFFATMIGEQAKDYFDDSVPADDGLRRVRIRDPRVGDHDPYMSFIRDEDHLKQKFHMFRPVHIGYMAAKYRSDERGDTFHWMFCGVKD